MTDDQNPGWSRGDTYWARPEHVRLVEGDYPSQDRYVLDPEVTRDIRVNHDPDESADEADD